MKQGVTGGATRHGPTASASGARLAQGMIANSAGNVNVTPGNRVSGASMTGCLSLLSSQPTIPRTASDEKEMTIWEQASAGMYTSHAKDNGKACSGGTGPTITAGTLSMEDMRSLLDGFRSQLQTDLLGAVQQEIGALRQELRDGHRCVNVKLDTATQDLQALRTETRIFRTEQQASSTSALQRMLGHVCGSAERRRAEAPTPCRRNSDLRNMCSTMSMGSVAEESEHHLEIPTSTSAHPGFAAAPHIAAVPTTPAAARQGGTAKLPATVDPVHQEAFRSHPLGQGRLLPAAVPATPPASIPRPPSVQAPSTPLPSGMLGPVIALWEEALPPEVASGTGTLTMPSEVTKEPFIRGLDIFSKVLDKLEGGKQMGDGLRGNITKLKESKANPAEEGYRAWIITELPVHGVNGFKEYVDKSAFMANLWIGLSLEFFVEFLALVHSGEDTRKSSETAYKKTLYKQHNFFQRQLFNGAMSAMPKRSECLRRLQGESDAGQADIERELGAFVRVGRPLVKFSRTLNDELDKMLQDERRRRSGH
mmetsp:Transcript_11917/g.23136  ORF Transcript_11917/g.23136 Transcript_11917/m.23136 type:complete len:537 (-) Transcript_11917:42-1652(-)|eukprot:CAMPEP_0172664838 /NCGR_PEP_ID=MMETSP1074-20121228/6863_1 /TAXON_ID=2916 /ORGANISM="Ceratium fusus, Strain PA161109" /LENGTH=536 /DNA_ID=CAMNT_0013481061 /DNA_START=24 /DNA_END=1634 /DNA_ORIENTATION=-